MESLLIEKLSSAKMPLNYARDSFLLLPCQTFTPHGFAVTQEAFTPDWVSAVFLALVGGIATVFGPDAAQRKKNREALAKKLVKK